jgi:heptosyltransferase I
MPPPITSILIVRLGAMGDIIHSLPGAASLKHSFPDARVTWVVEPNWVPLLEGNGFVDRIVVFRRKEPGSWRRTKNELRSEHYDLAVDFQGLTKSALIAHVARPERIAGFGSRVVRERLAGLFYSNRVQSNSVHVVDQALDLAAGACPRSLPRDTCRRGRLRSPVPWPAGPRNNGHSNTTNAWPVCSKSLSC